MYSLIFCDSVYDGQFWWQVTQDDLLDVWSPDLKFSRVVDSKSVSFWGKNIRQFDFWIVHVNDSYNIMKFYQSMKVTFACDFNFESFPFDSHECDLDFGSPSNSYNFSLKFSPVQVYILLFYPFYYVISSIH